MRGRRIIWVAVVVAAAVGVYLFTRRAQALPFDGRPAPTETQRDAAKHVAAAVDDFAFKLAHQVARERKGKNFLISPLSISTAHSMLLAGMVGAPKKELAGVLGYGKLSDEEIHGGMFALNYDAQRAENRQFRAANAFMMLVKQSLKPAFTHTLKDDYDADFRALPGATPESLKIVNNWVKAETDGMVPKILDLLPSHATFVLLNASAFAATWEKEFHASSTAPDTFTTGKGEKVQAPLMHEYEVKLLDRQNDDVVTAAELPYKGEAFGMVVLLPPEGQSVWRYLESLDGSKWEQLLASLTPDELEVTLPKFTFDDSFDVIPLMASLGAKRMFRDAGGLVGIGDQMSQSVVAIDVHKTHIEVDEKGTRAAAAAAVESTATAKADSFRADRAFVYAIVYKPTGLIVFLGVCSDPTQSR